MKKILTLMIIAVSVLATGCNTDSGSVSGQVSFRGYTHASFWFKGDNVLCEIDKMTIDYFHAGGAEFELTCKNLVGTYYAMSSAIVF